MPFERYLQDSSLREDDRPTFTPPEYGSPIFSNSVQFQLPSYLLDGPPLLAPGGGAEVLQASLNAIPGSASSWFNNNGFSTKHFVQETTPSHLNPYSSSSYVAEEIQQDIHSQFSPSEGGPQMSNPSQINTPSPLGLPVYSASGFDLMSILSRIYNRPNPSVVLGPVDMTCSFLIVDVRRHDHPIVYASPTFFRLTGYEEHEVIGRNCRFLQSPTGTLQRGEIRRFTSHEAVAHLKKGLSANKECQASLMNYKKDGTPFVNLVTVIPVTGGASNLPEEADDIAYHVGFQVDLTEQPNAILQRVRDGSYMVNCGSTRISLSHNRIDRRSNPINVASKELRAILTDSNFLESIPLTTSTNAGPMSPTEKPEGSDENHLLSLLLLESLPDFVHVLSLKGSFLYVAPSVRNVLGYEPEELVGRSISEYCYPADIVPLMRELKESSSPPNTQEGHPLMPIGLTGLPRTVDLLLRVQSKNNGYVWIECRGRLHSEPGKGRKAIILSGRRRGIPSLTWDPIIEAGGLASSVIGVDGVSLEKEFWGVLSGGGKFLVASVGVRDVVGWSAGDMVGLPIRDLVADIGHSRQILDEEFSRASSGNLSNPGTMSCRITTNKGSLVNVHIVLHRSSSSSPIVCQIKLAGAQSLPFSTRLLGTNVFEELETDRRSSWQYELQLVRNANQRLHEEISALEASLLPSPIYTPPPPSFLQQRRPSIPMASRDQTWSPASGKRSWDVANAGTPT